MISELLTDETIILNVDATNWRDVIEIGGRLLMKNESIESSYIDSMIQAVEELGPYIVIAPGIAMPHAEPENGVKKVGISLITLKKPVNFGHKENDPVSIVFCLAAIDHSSHLKVLSDLVQYLRNEKFLSLLKETSHKQNIIDFIKGGKVDD